MAQAEFVKRRNRPMGVPLAGSVIGPWMGSLGPVGAQKGPVCGPVGHPSELSKAPVGLQSGRPPISKDTANELNEYIDLKRKSIEQLPEAFIQSITASLMSTEDIKKASVVKVISPELKGDGSINDSHMGVSEDGMPCPTCNGDYQTCAGHLGYIELKEPIINPMHIRKVISVLKCVCNQDGTLLCSKQTLEQNGIPYIHDGERRLKRIEGISTNGYKCSAKDFKCKPNPEFNIEKSVETNMITYYKSTGGKKAKKDMGELYTYSVETVEMILSEISDESAKLLGFMESHPRTMIMHVIPVIPPCARLASDQDGKVWEDVLTLGYQSIVKANNQLAKEGISDTDKRRFTNEIIKKVKEILLTDPDSVSKRIKGKDSLIRGGLMGKRVNYSGRTVVSPDPTLKFGQMRVPPYIGKTITKPVRITPFNIKSMTDLLRMGRVSVIVPGPLSSNKKLIGKNKTVQQADIESYVPEVGDVFHRWLMTGDMVLSNRQPTLSLRSFMAFSAVIHYPPPETSVRKKLPGDPNKMYYGSSRAYMSNPRIGVNPDVPFDGPFTFGHHMAITKAFNMDFDGDEVNLQVPQTIEAEAEMLTLMSAKECIISDSTNQAAMGIMYNGLSGAYKLTQPDLPPIPLDVIMNSAMIIYDTRPDFDYNEWKERCERFKIPITSGRALFSMVLPTDFYYSHSNVVVREGVLLRGVLDSSIISTSFNSMVVQIRHMYGSQRAADFLTEATFLLDYWFSTYGFSLNIAECNPSTPEMMEKTRKEYTKARLMAESMGGKVKDPIEAELMERNLVAAINNVPNIGASILKENLSKDNALSVMIKSGAKGKEFNVAQMTATIGQQFLGGKRLEAGLSFHDPTDPAFALESRGYIQSSFMKGMTPAELFMHQTAGREGLVDTALSTSESGSAHHKMIKVGEDLSVDALGTIRNSYGIIFNFIYGADGLSPDRLMMIDIEHYKFLSFINMVSEVQRINLKYKKLAKERRLTKVEIRRILAFIEKNMSPLRSITKEVSDMAWSNIRKRLEIQLKHSAVKIIPVEKAFQDLENRIVNMLDRAQVVPGTMVGIRASEALGGPVTQIALNSFHSSGSSRNVASGIDIIRQLLGLTAPKFPSCILHFKNKHHSATSILEHEDEFVSVTLDDLKVDYDIETEVRPSDDEWFDILKILYKDKWDVVDKHWTMRLQLDTTKLYMHKITMKEIIDRLEMNTIIKCFGGPASTGILYIFVDTSKLEKFTQNKKIINMDNVAMLYFESQVLPTFPKQSFKGIPKIAAIFPVSTTVFEVVNVQLALTKDGQHTGQWQLMLDEWRMTSSGITIESVIDVLAMVGIKLVGTPSPLELIVQLPEGVDPSTKPGDHLQTHLADARKNLEKKWKELKKEEVQEEVYSRPSDPLVDAAQYTFCETNGANLHALLMNQSVDTYRTYCNEIATIYSLFGIEAARNLFIIEFKKNLDNEKQYTDPRHVTLISDLMFNQGQPNSASFHGQYKQKFNFLSLMTFEQSMTIQTDAATHGKKAQTDSTSASIMIGKRALVGTGLAEIIPDPQAESVFQQQLEANKPLDPDDLMATLDMLNERENGLQLDIDKHPSVTIPTLPESDTVPVNVRKSRVSRETEDDRSAQVTIAKSPITVVDPALVKAQSKLKLSSLPETHNLEIVSKTNTILDIEYTTERNGSSATPRPIEQPTKKKTSKLPKLISKSQKSIETKVTAINENEFLNE